MDYDVIFTGNAATQTISGDAYLYHPTSTLSLLGKMVVAMTAGAVAAPAAVLTRDRKVKLSGGANFSVQWTDTELRDLLGFTGNLAAASSYTATNVSPLLWSPAKPLYTELSPAGTLGNRKRLAYWTESPSDGSAFVVAHGERTDQRFSASHVAIDRVQTADQLGGEWEVLFWESLSLGRSFYVYPSVTEESGSGTTATLTGEMGPYVLTPQGRAASAPFKRSRGFEWLSRRADVVFDCHIVPEYS